MKGKARSSLKVDDVREIARLGGRKMTLWVCAASPRRAGIGLDVKLHIHVMRGRRWRYFYVSTANEVTKEYRPLIAVYLR